MFETPDPISVVVDVSVGDIEVRASERVDTVVDVRPSDPNKKGDVAAAAETRVEYAGGVLHITAPKGRHRYLPWRGGDSIDVRIDLPAASEVRGHGGVASLRCTGSVAACTFRIGVGAVHLDDAGAVQLRTGAGDVVVRRASGGAHVRTGSGTVEVGSVAGPASIVNANGDIRIGDAHGELQLVAANGTIRVAASDGAVSAKTANGDVRLGDVSRGAVVAETACGRIDVGVRHGVAAWLDLDARFGRVNNGLEAAAKPAATEAAVEVRARNAFGDITVHHSVAAAELPA